MPKIKYEIEVHRPDKRGNFPKFGAIEENGDWLNEEINKGSFGKPERWINLENADEWELTREVERESYMQEPEMEGDDPIEKIRIKVPADYSITETDITAQMEQEELARQEKQDKKDAAKAQLRDSVAAANSILELKDQLNKILDYLEFD